MKIPHSYLQILRESSRDEASYERLVALMTESRQEKNAELEHFFSITLDLWCIADVNGTFLKLSPMWEKTLGYPLDELYGERFLDFVHPDDMQATIAAISVLDSQQPIFNFTNRYRHKDGSYRFIEWRSQPDGKFIYAAARDVTEHRQMLLAVQESEARLRSIFEMMDDGVWSAEVPSIKMIYLNPAGERIFGRLSTEFYADISLYISTIHPEDQSAVLAAQTMLMKQGRMSWQYRIVRPDGEIRWIHNHAWVINDEQGNPIRIDGIFSDTTTRRVIEAQALELAVERERTRLLSDFINNTSHELRTPLTAISIGVYLMTRITDPELRKEKATQVEREIIYLNKIIQQLHNMAKLDGIQHLKTLRLNLNDLVNECVLEVRPQKSDITLVTELSPEALSIMGNREYFQRAFTPLLDNAIQFSPEGGVVTIRTLLKEGDVVVEVEDHGIGIAAEHLDHVFQRFYKVDPARSRTEAGIGMGLAAVKQIMRLHDGRAMVQSALGQGSTFSLHFPRV